MARIARAAAAAMLATALAGVGCARTSEPVAVDTNAGPRAVLAAADQTTRAATGHVHLEVAVHSGGSGTATTSGSRMSLTDFTLTGDGSYDRASGRSMMTIDFDALMDQVLRWLPGPAKDQAGRAPASGRTAQVVQQGSTIYLRSPGAGLIDPTLTDRWVKFDAASHPGPNTTGSGSPPGGGLIGPGSPVETALTGDPSAYLDYLKGVGAEVATVGPETVGGVATTHRRLVVSVRQALEAAGEDRGTLERSLDQLPETMAENIYDRSIPVDLNVDDQGYVRRIRLTGEGGNGTRTVLTVEFSDFGAPVDITVPPADQTIDVTQLMPRAGS